MVEINNQRKVPRYAGGSRRELITDVRKPEIMVMTSLVWGPFTDYSDHPRKLVTLNPKLKSLPRRFDATSFFPVGGMLTASSLAWKTLSEKSGRCGIAAD